MKMTFWTCLIPMEAAGTTVERFLYLYDKLFIGERAKAKGRDGGAVDGRDGCVDGRGKMHGGRIIYVVHHGVLHQGRRLQKREPAAEVCHGRVGRCNPDVFAGGG